MIVIYKLIFELSRLKTVCKHQEKLLHIFYDKEDDMKEEIIKLKTQLEEAKIVEDVMTSLLKEKEGWIENIKATIVSMRKQLEQKDNQLNMDKSTKVLKKTLSSEISPLIKFGLWFHKGKSRN